VYQFSLTPIVAFNFGNSTGMKISDCKLSRTLGVVVLNKFGRSELYK
tara:strand:+ start:1325 stop:1465 length:141 start_codon:yes stop_codon:yes gene_type:complete